MNLAGCWLGAMPVCHGAGGLAAQYRFGARSGASVALLGGFKLVLGLLFGETLLDLLQRFPRGILGVMVVAAGLELAMVGESLNHGASDLWEAAVADGAAAARGDGIFGGAARRCKQLTDQERRERWAVMLMTAGGILAFKNDAVGFIAGMLCHGAYRLADCMAKRRSYHRAGEANPLLR